MNYRRITLPLTYTNPRRREYEPLIEQQRIEVQKFSIKMEGGLGPIMAELMKSTFSSPWSEIFSDHPKLAALPETLPAIARNFARMLQEGLRGSILVDLAGTNMAAWASLFRIAGYVGVDIYANGEFNPDFRSDPITDVTDDKTRQLYPGIALATFRADILDFLSRLPESSGHRLTFMANGVDNNIFPSRDYRRAVGEELVRVMPVGSVIVAIKTEVFDDLAPESQARMEKTLYPFLRDGEAWICKKVL